MWTLIKMDLIRLKTEEMISMKRTVGYSLLDSRRNEDILEEFKLDPVEKKLAQYKQKW
jgi:hypothetical protein